MRKFNSMLLCLIFIVMNSKHAYAEAPKLTEECVLKMKLRDEEYSLEVMNDIKKSFGLDITDEDYFELTARDLLSAHILYGGKQDDPILHSIEKHLSVKSKGGARLYIKPLEAFVLHKQLNNENVLTRLKLVDFSRWEVVEQNKKMGLEVPYKQLACEKEYLKKRNEYAR